MVNDIDRHIAMRMRELRELKGLTQKELADILGFKSHVNINNMEQAKQSFTVKTIYLMCSVFNVTPNDLFPEIKNAQIVLQPKKREVIKEVIVTHRLLKVKGLPKIK